MPKPDLKFVEPTPAPTPEELKAMLKADRLAREKRAAERIKQVLAEERCTMSPVVVLSDRGMTSRVEIAAVD